MIAKPTSDDKVAKSKIDPETGAAASELSDEALDAIDGGATYNTNTKQITLESLTDLRSVDKLKL